MIHAVINWVECAQLDNDMAVFGVEQLYVDPHGSQPMHTLMRCKPDMMSLMGFKCSLHICIDRHGQHHFV
jgi:hypothetical protein